MRLALGIDAPADAAEREGKQQEGSELRREGLGRGDPDLGAGAREEAKPGGPHQRRFRDVAHGEAMRLAEPARVIEGGERVRRFPRLRDGDHERIRIGHRVPVAVLARDLHVAGNSGERLEPVARDEPGVPARAASEDERALHARQDVRRLRAEEPGGEGATMHRELERVGDRARLLEDLLLHVVVEVAELHRLGGQFRMVQGALDHATASLHHAHAVQREVGAVAVLEEDHALGHLHQRGGVGCGEVFLLADAQEKRRSHARDHHAVRVVLGDDRDGIRAFEAAGGAPHRLEQPAARDELVVDQVRDDLRVGLRAEDVAERCKL